MSMTKYEKWILAFSGLATLIPAIALYRADAYWTEYRDRGRLLVSAPKVWVTGKGVEVIEVAIKNIGKLPARKTQVSVEYATPPDEVPVVSDPPFPMDIEKSADSSKVRHVTLRRPIAPDDTIKLCIGGSRSGIKAVYVYSETGDPSLIYRGEPHTGIVSGRQPTGGYDSEEKRATRSGIPGPLRNWRISCE